MNVFIFLIFLSIFPNVQSGFLYKDIRCFPGLSGEGDSTVWRSKAMMCTEKKCQSYCGTDYILSRQHSGDRLRDVTEKSEANRNACECVIENAQCVYHEGDPMSTRLPKNKVCSQRNCVTACYDWAGDEHYYQHPKSGGKLYDKAEPPSWELSLDAKKKVCKCTESMHAVRRDSPGVVAEPKKKDFELSTFDLHR